MASITHVFSQEQHGHLVPYIAALHASCITLDHMVGPFLPPLTNEKLLPWWKERLAEANNGTRIIVLLLPELSLGKKPQGTDLRGLAMLKLSESETGSFRGHIDAVLVDRRHRRQGGAKALVAALEYEAAKRGRSLLVGLSRFPSAEYSRMGALVFYDRQWLTCAGPARRHRDGQRGRGGLQEIRLH
jgi:GNAT superfamily N-acetyltransferase